MSIPAVDFEGDFVASGWKDSALGKCSATVDSAGRSGFVTYGKAGEVRDASMRVVASKNGEIFVEVEDDKWVGPSAKWVKDDHLELWLAKELPGYMDHCLSGEEEGGRVGPKQWGIRVADGKVFAGFGTPKPEEKAISVERSSAPGGAGAVRFKIVIPKGFGAVTVSYSDSDDGKKQERLIATSKLVHGKLATLGALEVIDGKSAACRVDGGKLEPVIKAFVGDKAILGG